MENFPLELEVTVTFEDLGRMTKMTLTHAGIENIDPKMRDDMEQGWNESFDKMSQNLESGGKKETQRPPGSDPHRNIEGHEARS